MNKFMTILATALAAVSCGQGQPQQTRSQVVEDVIMSRRSIRNYRQVPVARDTMEVILNAGINAPNGQNRQSWEIRVVDNPATLEEFREAMAAAKPGNLDRSNSCAHFRWGITLCRRPMSAMPR